MKKMISVLLSLIMIFGLFTVSISASGTEIEASSILQVLDDISNGIVGTEVCVEGSVTYVNGDEVFIQNGSNGICVHLNEAIDDLRVNDYITVIGTTSTSGSYPLPEIVSAQISTIMIMDNVVPHEVTFGELISNPAEYLCTLVSFKASIESYNDSNYPILTNGEYSIPCYKIVLDPEVYPVGTEVSCELVLSASSGLQFRGYSDMIKSGSEEDGGIVDIKILATSDVHGQLYATNYTADSAASGTYSRGLTRAASYVNEQRSKYKNIFLADCGDFVQGTPLTYYYAFEKPEAEDPAMKALRTMGYDMFVLGNHEFNYGLDILGRQLNYLTSEPTEGESQVAVSAANYLDASSNTETSKDWKTWNNYAPYLIKDYDGVKVAVMGIGNPNIPKWDVPENWKGIYFAGVVETYEHYKEEMESQADIIVIMSHSGIDSSPDSDFIRELIESTTGIDLVFCGHEHLNSTTEILNAESNPVNVVSLYTKARTIGDALIKYNKSTKQFSIDVNRVSMENYPIDNTLANVLQPYEVETWQSYMNNIIGYASAGFPSADIGTAPSAFMDLINKVQLWGTYDRTGLNTPDTTEDDTQAQLSISAPLTSGDAIELISEGNIVMGDMFKLYRFENWFYQIKMTGKEIKTWLEFAATKIEVDENGNPFVSSGNLTYYDVIYGDGFSYVINYLREEGSRVISMTYNGNEIADEDTFTVVLNNYRFNGGGNYISYLQSHGCENFIANDKNRIIYSTQYDMIQGEDKGQARNLLADYITEQQMISPDVTSTWKLQNNDMIFTYGDLDSDGDVTMQDVVMLQKIVAEIIEPSPEQKSAGNLDNDENITMVDVTILQKFIAEMITELPIK